MQMSASEILKSPRLKVERAYRHINELRTLTNPLSRDLYTVTVEKDVGPTDADRVPFGLVYRPTQPIPETLALVIGDAVHNLRAALDHVCTGILRTTNPAAKQHFPIHPMRKNLVTAPVLALMEEALPGSTELILKKLRPENGPNETLWRFNDLDNDDKHNLLIPTVSVVCIKNINARIGTNKIVNCSVGGNAAMPIYLIAGGMPIIMQNRFETEVDVSFREGGLFENEPVIPTLMRIGNVVSGALDAFERLILAQQ